MKQFSLLILFVFVLMQAKSQQVIPLYNNNEIPGAKIPPVGFVEQSTTSTDGNIRVSKVTEPSLTLFLPKNPNATAVIICPGGGYSILSIKKEGYDVAQKFAEMGVTAFVLKYRLPNDTIMVDKSLAPLQDALQAIYLVRKNATLWNINPNKIGVMGFSAGGHLASSLSVHYNDAKIQNPENISLRPDFSVLIYPVISFGPYAHAGSVKRLLGEQPTEAQKAYFSNELHINAQTPPTFLVHANNDMTVPAKNSLMYTEALVKNKVKVATHLYQSGGHGFGLNNKNTTENWFETLKNWMAQNNF